MCQADKPIFTSSQDKMTTETERQILEHNKTGARYCGWKPGK